MARMELVIVLFGVVVLGFVVFGLLLLLGVVGSSRAAQKNVDNAESVLDAAFDGRDDVTFQITLVSLPFATVVAGAKARGYRLAHQSGADKYGGQTLMFERVVAGDTAESDA